MSTTEERLGELEAENAALRAENTVLRAQVSELPGLRAQVEELAAHVQALQARLGKDSHNSSKPPSSDGLKRKTKSLRAKSGKKPGGQLGHRGETLHLVATPDEVVEHRPARCAQCQTPLADAEVMLRERRQVHELPPVVRLVVQEHRALHVRCPHCAHVSVGMFPPDAPSRAQYGSGVRALAVYLVEQQHLPLGRVPQLLADLVGLRLARGTLVGWIQQAARVLEPVEQHLKGALSQAPVLHHDETGVRRAGKLAWAHVTSTSRLTHYAIHTKRGHEAMDAIGILPAYRGVSGHDGWGSYGVYTACRHALCNVHHLRELTFLEEEYHQGWASDLKALLREMKAATEQARALGHVHVPPAQRQDFVDRYHALLRAGLAANPPPPDQERRPGQRGRLAQSPARNLLERLLLQQDQVLAFLEDLAIPFDNNQAERDLRDLKIQQKVSGCFRSDGGAQVYATIRGYLATLRKQGHALLAALNTVFAGRPLYPASA
jgi:transposase